MKTQKTKYLTNQTSSAKRLLTVTSEWMHQRQRKLILEIINRLQTIKENIFLEQY